MAVAQPSITAAQTAVAPVTPRRKIRWGTIAVNVVLAVICIMWTVPTLGLLVSSFRTREDIGNTGWWTVVPHQDWVTASQVQLQTGIALDQPLQVAGNAVTDAQLIAGYTLPNGQQVRWANRRSRLVNIQEKQVVANANFSLDNYQNVLAGGQYQFTAPDGTVKTEQGADMSSAFISTLTVAIPATLIPILIAAFAAPIR